MTGSKDNEPTWTRTEVESLVPLVVETLDELKRRARELHPAKGRWAANVAAGLMLRACAHLLERETK